MSRLIGKLCVVGVLSIMTAVTASCGGNKSDPLTYEIEIRSSKDKNIKFENAKAKVTLYGNNKFVADNTATVIYENSYHIDSIPTTINMEWSKDSYKLIKEPKVERPEDAIYYINVAIDSNSDGSICKGDYSRDYDKSPFETISEAPTQPLVFYVKKAKSCQ